MKRKRKKRAVGRPYSPWDRIALAERYATLKYEFLRAGKAKPGYEAELALHAEYGGKRSLQTLKKLRVRGRCESILQHEEFAEMHNQRRRRS